MLDAREESGGEVLLIAREVGGAVAPCSVHQAGGVELVLWLTFIISWDERSRRLRRRRLRRRLQPLSAAASPQPPSPQPLAAAFSPPPSPPALRNVSGAGGAGLGLGAAGLSPTHRPRPRPRRSAAAAPPRRGRSHTAGRGRRPARPVRPARLGAGGALRRGRRRALRLGSPGGRAACTARCIMMYGGKSHDASHGASCWCIAWWPACSG